MRAMAKQDPAERPGDAVGGSAAQLSAYEQATREQRRAQVIHYLSQAASGSEHSGASWHGVICQWPVDITCVYDNTLLTTVYMRYPDDSHEAGAGRDCDGGHRWPETELKSDSARKTTDNQPLPRIIAHKTDLTTRKCSLLTGMCRLPGRAGPPIVRSHSLQEAVAQKYVETPPGLGCSLWARRPPS